jgi:hypothetical protein
MPVALKQILAGNLDLVPRLFEFLEQAEKHNIFDFGGEGSGNWGHEGRPGEIGGSGEGGGESTVAKAAPAAKGFTTKQQEKIEANVKESLERVLKYNPSLNTPEGRAATEKTLRDREEKALIEKVGSKRQTNPELKVEKQKSVETAKEEPKSEPPKTEIKPEPKPELKVDVKSGEQNTAETYIAASKALSNEAIVQDLKDKGVANNFEKAVKDGKLSSDHLQQIHASISQNIDQNKKDLEGKLNAINVVKPGKDYKDADAWYDPNDKTININQEALKYADNEKIIAYNKEQNFHPENCFGLKATVDHEIGHAVISNITKNAWKSPSMTIEKSTGDVQLDSKFESISNKNEFKIAKDLSVYATTNKDEFMAETYAYMKNNTTIKPAIKEYYDAMMERVRG